MSSENKNKNPLFISFLTLGFLFIFSSIQYPSEISIFKLRNFCLYQDILKNNNDNSETLDDIPDENIKYNPTISYFKALSDTFSFIQSQEKVINESFKSDETLVYKASAYDNVFFFKPLDSFFNSLKNTEQNGKKIRVAYFGDSMIEGDLITQTIRELLQNKFGGNGVGFVPITTRSAQYRNSIKHTFSKDWQSFPFNKYKDMQFGLSGYVFNPSQIVSANSYMNNSDNSWVAFKSSNVSKRLNKFHVVKLYYGTSRKSNILKCEIDNKQEVSQQINGKYLVNEFIANNTTPINEVKFNFITKENLNVYGVSFEDTSGIYIDNYSFRGNSGVNLVSIPKEILTDFNKYMDYSLVVLQYGVNVADPSMKSFGWYEKAMINVINYIKQTMPKASILLVSVGDRAWKNGTVYETSPAIPKLINAQKHIAQRTGVAFWNLFEAMGGNNSIIDWVENEAPLANKDYTHFNHRGADRVARLMTKDILSEYENYKNNEQEKYLSQRLK
ncbi:MAG: hypothetical protein A2X12_01000 [Bacteroidetes bacterium GWE2_29_8]|nr:MAG: hypothetical protein A2X12_01000 [Bacteroidetes bacterium GWE2_29_8]OFY15131.1 MAG: hypothetical protein A2X02_06540 [Bacteroidetes bacterium GWF2_29_10]